MDNSSALFFAALDSRIERFNLLNHPFYQAWSKGELTRDDLREYASEYWHHVSAFPAYLSALHSQLPDGTLRRTILENLADEEGLHDGKPHSDLWMDFARGMGADESAVRNRELGSDTSALLSHYREAMTGSPAEALAALYTYESRVPAIAATKAEGLENSLWSGRRHAALLHRSHHGGRPPCRRLARSPQQRARGEPRQVRSRSRSGRRRSPRALEGTGRH